jgi:hypothetical protein
MSEEKKIMMKKEKKMKLFSSQKKVVSIVRRVSCVGDSVPAFENTTTLSKKNHHKKVSNAMAHLSISFLSERRLMLK